MLELIKTSNDDEICHKIPDNNITIPVVIAKFISKKKQRESIKNEKQKFKKSEKPFQITKIRLNNQQRLRIRFLNRKNYSNLLNIVFSYTSYEDFFNLINVNKNFRRLLISQYDIPTMIRIYKTIKRDKYMNNRKEIQYLLFGIEENIKNFSQFSRIDENCFPNIITKLFEKVIKNVKFEKILPIFCVLLNNLKKKVKFFKKIILNRIRFSKFGVAFLKFILNYFNIKEIENQELTFFKQTQNLSDCFTVKKLTISRSGFSCYDEIYNTLPCLEKINFKYFHENQINFFFEEPNKQIKKVKFGVYHPFNSRSRQSFYEKVLRNGLALESLSLDCYELYNYSVKVDELLNIETSFKELVLKGNNYKLENFLMLLVNSKWNKIERLSVFKSKVNEVFFEAIFFLLKRKTTILKEVECKFDKNCNEDEEIVSIILLMIIR